MADGEYRVYRSRRTLMERLRGPDSLRNLRPNGGRRRRSGRRRGLGAGRVVRFVLLAVLAWIVLSAVVFVLSSLLGTGADDRTEEALSGGSSLLTGSTILVLGSDARPEGTKEPGAGGPSRADSILLLHAGVGDVQRLSIPRDSLAEIPGRGAQKINAAYAFGGPALTVRTVENFLGNGLEINHVVEVSFENFPRFIDALGGIDVNVKRSIRSPPFGGRPFRIKKGERHLDGDRALRFARVRKNLLAPNEDDRTRAQRQQEVVRGIRRQFTGPLNLPGTFVRLPLIAWQAPRTIETDMGPLALSGLFLDIVTGGTGRTRVVQPSGPGPGGSLLVADFEKQAAVRRLLGDDAAASAGEPSRPWGRGRSLAAAGAAAGPRRQAEPSR
jgi:LCP family protein required for cell wall assembly